MKSGVDQEGYIHKGYAQEDEASDARIGNWRAQKYSSRGLGYIE